MPPVAAAAVRAAEAAEAATTTRGQVAGEKKRPGGWREVSMAGREKGCRAGLAERGVPGACSHLQCWAVDDHVVLGLFHGGQGLGQLLVYTWLRLPPWLGGRERRGGSGWGLAGSAAEGSEGSFFLVKAARRAGSEAVLGKAFGAWRR